MVKKQRLSDLLHEEAEKLPSEGAVIEVTAEEVLEEDALSVDESSTDMSETTPVRRTNPTKADLEATVKELTAKLERSRQKESSLQQQITALRSDFDEQTTYVQKLQKDIEQANQIQAEFKQAKKAALELAESNSQLVREVNALRAENGNLKAQKHEVQHNSETNQKQKNQPADFAANTWLL